MTLAIDTPGSKHNITGARQAYYDKISKYHLAPLWEVLKGLVTPEPKTQMLPALWKFGEVEKLMLEAGDVITAEEAERRVLILENPGIHGHSGVTQSLYAGLQLVLPGEVARTHRHVAAALRLVIESEGGYTAVDGERVTMHPGDFILTPSWTWHDHGNPGQKPVIWLDGLDIPIVNHFETSFFEHYPEEVQPVVLPQGDSLARYGGNMMPLEYQPPRLSSLVFTYPYARSRETLEHVYRNSPLHPCHGAKMQFINPATGGYTMPTIGAFLQLLPTGFTGAPYRATDGTVYCVVEGRGQSRVGESAFAWKEHDIFVAPSWYPISHHAESVAVLFSFSDRPVQKALGLWREQAPML
jgi:gentisate 1,2-dioxygenase